MAADECRHAYPCQRISMLSSLIRCSVALLWYYLLLPWPARRCPCASRTDIGGQPLTTTSVATNTLFLHRGRCRAAVGMAVIPRD